MGWSGLAAAWCRKHTLTTACHPWGGCCASPGLSAVMSASPRHPSSSGQPLSERTLALASVALAVYLVGLVLSIAGNSVSGSSPLIRTITQRLFSPWMGPAWLDLGFDHPLTYGLPEDADHSLEVRGFEAEGSPLRLPGDRTGERSARWRRLARQIALADADEAAIPLVVGIGVGAFKAVGAADVSVRALRWPLEERGAAPQTPRPVKPYEARVRRVDGEVQLIELGGEAKRGELAPVLRDQPAGSGSVEGKAAP